VNLVRPSLLVLTKQIPISHSAMMSSGLLSLRQGIGTDSDYTVGEPECNPPQVSC
jgi:hypothetical protein